MAKQSVSLDRFSEKILHDFDREFTRTDDSGEYRPEWDMKLFITSREVKEFIAEALAQQKAMFVERIDNLPRHDILVDDMDAGYMGGVVYGYNLAKDDVIKAIQDTNQEEEME